MRLIAFIPLRGGSQSIPRKNIKPLAGRPLCDWTIRTCLDSGVFDEVWVSTDDDAIAEVARRSGAHVFRRSPETATATASTESAMVEFARQLPDFDVMCLVQATSPLTKPEHLRAAWSRFQAEQADSLVTVTRHHRFRWAADGTPLNYDPLRRPRRQDWGGELFENGAFYLTRRHLLLESACRLGGRMIAFEMPPWTAVEIDEPEDWIMLESLARRYGHHPASRPIRLFVTDIDGVMTDGGFYYTEEGEFLKRFHTRDGEGLAQLLRAGVEVGIITGEASGFTPARARKIGVSRLALGVKHKLPVLDTWRQELGLEWSEVAYIGDDVSDLPCLEVVGAAACPADAEPEAKALAHLVTGRPGGQAAVREFVRSLFDQNRIPSATAERTDIP